MCVCVCECVCVSVCVCVCVCVCVSAYISMQSRDENSFAHIKEFYICMYLSIYICLSIHPSLSVYLFLYPTICVFIFFLSIYLYCLSDISSICQSTYSSEYNWIYHLFSFISVSQGRLFYESFCHALVKSYSKDDISFLLQSPTNAA